MISIQDLGLQILGDSPKKLYILGGSEYGVKQKYIEHLDKLYGNHIESASFDLILEQMKGKHIIPLEPAVYIVRYDDKFATDLNEVYAETVRNSNIVGTVVCLYENDKQLNKFDKYLPEFTAIVSNVSAKFVTRYLHDDFPKLDDRSIKIAVNYSSSYGHARTICSAMNQASAESLAALPEVDVARMFGCIDASSESEIQINIASKNFKKLIDCIARYQDDPDRILYTVLQTMIELEKIKCAKYSDSPLKEYAKYWTIQDIYFMFMNTYEQLSKLRSMSSYNVEDSLIYLFALLRFQKIPSPEVMDEFYMST